MSEVVNWAKVAACNNVKVLMHLIFAEFWCDSDYDCRSEQLKN
jgi:arabinogalactan endo-1,4-beta-galactosidase